MHSGGYNARAGRGQLTKRWELDMSSDFTARFGARDFPGHKSRWTGLLTFSSGQLVHALFTTGRAPGDRAKFGLTSYWEFVHRASLVPAYVRRHPTTGRLLRTGLAVSLDRSEKVALSYALGQAMTGIFCELQLGVGHLMHVDRYAVQYGLAFGAGRRRADLFGHRASGWVVAEAKGRSNAMETGLDAKLRLQKRSVKTVGGAVPDLALGCVASFPAPHGVLRVDALDPDPDQETSMDLPVTRDAFLLAYYQPFVTALSVSQNVGNDGVDQFNPAVDYSLARIEGLGITIGLPTELVTLVQTTQEEDVVQSGFAARVDAILTAAAGSTPHADGSLFVTEWADELGQSVDSISEG